jgi:hypothetical protein
VGGEFEGEAGPVCFSWVSGPACLIVDMFEMVRCPYCAEIMKAGTDGDWYLCPACDHVTITSYPSYLCSCERCTSLRPPPVIVL